MAPAGTHPYPISSCTTGLNLGDQSSHFLIYWLSSNTNSEPNPPGKVVKIVRLGKRIRPTDGEEWERAKLAFRGSLQVGLGLGLGLG